VTQQIKVYAGEDTIRKWGRICSQFTSNTAAFAVLVERYYNQMEGTMDEEKIVSIRYGFHAADLFEGWQDEDPEKYDEQASAEKYARQVEDKLHEAYPGAEVEVVYDFGASGVLPDSLRTEVNGQNDHDEVNTVEHLAGLVYQDFEWCVNRE